jgi:hypothetical protein
MPKTGLWALYANEGNTVKHYVLAIQGGNDPALFGPYEDAEIRDTVGSAMRGRQNPSTDATFALDIDDDGTGQIKASSFDSH